MCSRADYSTTGILPGSKGAALRPRTQQNKFMKGDLVGRAAGGAEGVGRSHGRQPQLLGVYDAHRLRPRQNI